MKIPRLHAWPRSPRTAIALQKRLAERVDLALPRAFDGGAPRMCAGIDCAFSPDGSHIVAGVVVWDATIQAVVESVIVRRPCRFPYVPGLLSFREIPAVLVALRMLRERPDVVLCDAQGVAHPRRMGLATHLGLWLEMPTVGCAKSRLCGEFAEPGRRRGSASALMHDGEHIGTVLRTRDGVKPLFVSPGNRCDHEFAVRITLAASLKYRLPEPTRLAHQLVTRARTAK